MQKNKFILTLRVIVLCMLILAGCKSGVADVGRHTGTDRKSIVCTTFPSYDWTREILGTHLDDFELVLLLGKGGDLHSYQPAVGDIAAIISADMFVHVGGESDKWVAEVLKNAHNQDMRVVNLMETLGDAVKEEEEVRGIKEARHEHGSYGAEYDEHVWLSLKNASVLTKALSGNIKELDKANAKDYEANEKAYLAQLASLDDAYAKAVREAGKKTILFGDRFPFRYMADDYGLDYYAAFTGCSTQTSASFEIITFLSGKADELGLKSILIIEGSGKRIAEVIKQNTRDKNQEILVMNSLQSVTAEDIEGGFTYLNAMRDNLETLKKAIQ